MILTFALYLLGFFGLSTFVVHTDGSALDLVDLFGIFLIQIFFMFMTAGYLDEAKR